MTKNNLNELIDFEPIQAILQETDTAYRAWLIDQKNADAWGLLVYQFLRSMVVVLTFTSKGDSYELFSTWLIQQNNIHLEIRTTIILHLLEIVKAKERLVIFPYTIYRENNV